MDVQCLYLGYFHRVGLRAGVALPHPEIKKNIDGQNENPRRGFSSIFRSAVPTTRSRSGGA